MKTTAVVALALVLTASLLLEGCVTDTTTPITAPQTKVAPAQRATITGKIIDGCTMAAINGAVLSFGNDGVVSTTTSDISGSFAFANVPVGQYTTIDGKTVFSGTYTITASMVNYNKSEKDSTLRYRDYYYSTVTIIFTSVVDSTGLLGLVGAANFTITNTNTKIQGSIVDMNMVPVGNAQVVLFDQTINPGVAIRMTTTNANGIYTFYNVDNGITVSLTAKSSDGKLQGNLGGFGLPCNVPFDSLRPQFTPEQLMITPVDNVAPYVIAVSPENNADVSAAGLQIIYQFSEPIKQNAYTRTTLGFGHGTIIDGITVNFVGLKKTTATIPFSAAWDSTYTRFTITPQGLVGSAKYNVNAVPAFTSGSITDIAGNALTNNGNIVGDFEALNFTSGGGSSVPATPVLTRRMIPGTFDNLDFGGGNVGLEWNYDPNARSYNVYRSVANGPFVLLSQNVLNTQYTDASGALYTGALPDPYAAISVNYQVTGVSKDLVEGTASNVISVSDNVKPKFLGNSLAIDSTSTNATKNNVYYITLPFTEPLAIASAENTGAYAIANTYVPLTVAKADYIGKSGANYVVQLTVSPLGGFKPNGPGIPTLTVQNSVTDLAGNHLDVSNAGNIYVLPAFFYDGLDAAWSNSGQTPAGWTRTPVSGATNWSQKVNPLAAAGRGGIPTTKASVDGNSSAFFPSDATAGNTTRLETPSINLSNATTPSLSVWYVNKSGTDVLRIRYSIDNGTSWNTITTLTTSASSDWEQHVINLAVVAGQPSVLLGFEAVADGVTGTGGDDIWLDGVYVRQ